MAAEGAPLPARHKPDAAADPVGAARPPLARAGVVTSPRRLPPEDTSPSGQGHSALDPPRDSTAGRAPASRLDTRMDEVHRDIAASATAPTSRTHATAAGATSGAAVAPAPAVAGGAAAPTAMASHPTNNATPQNAAEGRQPATASGIGRARASQSAARRPKQRPNLSEATRETLHQWLFEHWEHPYPTKQEKAALAEKCGISVHRVNNWLMNARYRLWRPAGGRRKKTLDRTVPGPTPKRQRVDDATTSAASAAAAAAARVGGAGVCSGRPAGAMVPFPHAAHAPSLSFGSGVGAGAGTGAGAGAGRGHGLTPRMSVSPTHGQQQPPSAALAALKADAELQMAAETLAALPPNTIGSPLDMMSRHVVSSNWLVELFQLIDDTEAWMRAMDKALATRVVDARLHINCIRLLRAVEPVMQGLGNAGDLRQQVSREVDRVIVSIGSTGAPSTQLGQVLATLPPSCETVSDSSVVAPPGRYVSHADERQVLRRLIEGLQQAEQLQHRAEQSCNIATALMSWHARAHDAINSAAVAWAHNSGAHLAVLSELAREADALEVTEGGMLDAVRLALTTHQVRLGLSPAAATMRAPPRSQPAVGPPLPDNSSPATAASAAASAAPLPSRGPRVALRGGVAAQPARDDAGGSQAPLTNGSATSLVLPHGTFRTATLCVSGIERAATLGSSNTGGAS